MYDANQLGLILFQWYCKSYVNNYMRCVYNHNLHDVLLQTGNYFSSLIVLEIRIKGAINMQWLILKSGAINLFQTGCCEHMHLHMLLFSVSTIHCYEYNIILMPAYSY